MLKGLLEKIVGKLPGIDSLVNLPTTISENIRFIGIVVLVLIVVVVGCKIVF